MDLTTMSINDLKALDWDFERQIEQIQANRNIVHQEIVKKSTQTIENNKSSEATTEISAT